MAETYNNYQISKAKVRIEKYLHGILEVRGLFDVDHDQTELAVTFVEEALQFLF